MDFYREGWELAYNAVAILVGAGSLRERLRMAAGELELIDPVMHVPAPLRAECRRLNDELRIASDLCEDEAVDLAERSESSSFKQ